MILNGVVKVLKVNREGVDKNGNLYVHCSAVSYDSNEQFVMVKAFGSTAEYISRNLNSPRRAFISGDLVIDTYEETTEVVKVVSFGGTKKKVKFPIVEEKTSVSINARSLQFIDKRKEDDLEIEEDLEDEDYLECEDYVEEDEDLEEADENEAFKKVLESKEVEEVEIELEADEKPKRTTRATTTKRGVSGKALDSDRPKRRKATTK